MLPKAYDPQATEDRIYKLWEESGAFRADARSAKEAFAVSMPPPNATGQLHLGHAVMLALEDIFVRFARMRGKEALWLPGTDHAAIATESVVIKKIQKEEKVKDPRTHYGREKLVEKIAEFVEKSQGTIRSQIRKMGSSCDWSRERYTLDPALSRCVNEVFVKMYKDGLIYRGNRVVNWDTALQTTISDDEIEYVDREGTLWTFEYLSAKQTGGEPLFVATSRPETKLGDNAIIVHPDDERYQHLVGRHFEVEWPGGVTRHVTVIADHTVDRAFGTGAIGCTPFHSKVDFEIWQRHKEEILSEPLQVIGEDGLMTEHAGDFAGLSIEHCREHFVAGLQAQGRLLPEEKYVQPLSISYRSKQPVEPIPKLQWFIDVNKKVVSWKGKMMSLKEVMQEVVRCGDVRIIPDRFAKTYFQWIDNLQDWCISRQIWWGHRVPVWYRGEGDGERETYVGVAPPAGAGWEQDPDTLDTWFSSGLWTWSTLIDPVLAGDFSLSLEDLLRQSSDFRKFHPTSVMETGYDILFFWVARMILMSTYATGQIPFKTVYLHGLVRTREGKKMSKSDPQTCIDPLEIIAECGADALRMSMIVGQSPGNDFRLYKEKIGGYRNFVNKLWNASRFVLLECEKAEVDPHTITKLPDLKELSLADRAVLHASEVLIEEATQGLEEYRLSEVGERLYSFVWDFFCDWYLELSKGNANHAVLVHVLRRILKLLHPYCPFVTEELWIAFKPVNAELLITEAWPTVKEERKDPDAYSDFSLVIAVISAIRSLRADHGVEPGAKVSAIIHADCVKLLTSQRAHIERIARLSDLTVDAKAKKHAHAASTFLTGGIEVHVPLEGLIDLEKERTKLTKELKDVERFLTSIQAKLTNKKFLENAPEEVVALEKEKLTNAQEKAAKLQARLKTFA
ncbi:valine--tRNA ligase [Candidatus Peregrinibacteria bacterium CG10_big_fil_rev_8_21_14_0_10_55_24]|nr:MAG: valine--tRNA ligase [Candidatus Peregrinibacteria bacterium CG10_big_fil_rev_8_21_14_0_10_55_24]